MLDEVRVIAHAQRLDARRVARRLKSDNRHSAGIVYNNFPLPEPIDKQRRVIKAAAQDVLDARAAHFDLTLADPVTIPPNLVNAHLKLDRMIDAAYGFTCSSGLGR